MAPLHQPRSKVRHSWWNAYTRWTQRLYLSIRTRILIGYLVILLVAAAYLINRMWEDVRPYYREAQEEVMVDAVNLLAAVAGAGWSEAGPDLEPLQAAFNEVRTRQLSASIYELEKRRVDLYGYITDTRGVVLFNTLEPDTLGSDFSQWNDVVRTLRGEYGARTTWLPIDGEESSVLFVAAPILKDGQLVGVFSLAKPSSSMEGYLERTRRRIIWLGLWAVGAVALVGVLLSAWITYPIRNLISYAQAVRDGRPAQLPYLGHSEMRTLGQAFEEMRDALEGKDYVNRYVQTLTHELKSPIAAIRGAAELLEEAMPPEDRQRFLANIRTETGRLEEAIETLLLLASLETRKGLDRAVPVDLSALIRQACERLGPRASLKNIELAWSDGGQPTSPQALGDPFLLERAVAGLLENALDFSPTGSRVEVALRQANGQSQIIVRDSGSGIPDYARERIFERFYSLPRPDTGRKSSGLGLALIREIALLHRGSITVANRAGGGVEAVLALPSIS